MSRSDIVSFFQRLEPLMSDAPATTDSVWMSARAFVPGNSAPQARQGSIRSLVDVFVRWARTGIPERSA